MADQAETARTARTEATVSDEGDVLCACGKKIAKIDENDVEWKCRFCDRIVYLPNEALFLKNCSKALDVMDRIVTAMAQRRSAA